MKFQNELQGVVEKMEAIKDKIASYAEQLKASGEYQDFETRLAWDVLKAVVGTSKICEWYDQYNCNDSHIGTLAKKALKQVYTVD
jgi:hypothetical protein